MNDEVEHIIEEIHIPLETYTRLIRRANELGVTKEMFVTYALLRYIDERTPMQIDLSPPTA